MSALAQLHHLLRLPFDPDHPPALTLESFSAWKPLVERAALAQQPGAEVLNELIITLAQASQDEACLALAWWIRGNAHYFLDQPQQALAAYEQAEMLYSRRNEPLQMARLQVGKIGALGELGQYEQALKLGQAAAPLLRQSPDEADQQRLITLINNSAINNENLGRYTEALDGYQQALAWWQHKRQRTSAAAFSPTEGMPQEHIETDVEIARIQVNIGIAKTWLGLYAEARQLFEQTGAKLDALAIGENANAAANAAVLVADTRLRLDLNRVWLEMQANSSPAAITTALQRAYQNPVLRERANATMHINLILSEMEWRLFHGTFREADAQTLQQAKTQLQQLGLAHETGYAEVLWAQALLQSGEVDAACAAFRQTAIEAIARGDGETESRASLGEARAWRQSGNWAAARAVLQRTLNRIEQTQSKLVVSDFRLGFLESKLSAYHELASLLLEHGQALAALDVVERTKARTLADLLAAKPTVLNSDSPDSPDGGALPKPASLGQMSAGSDLKLLDTADLIRASERASARFRPDEMSVASAVDEVCTHIPSGILAINYAVLGNQAWAFLVTRDGLIAPPQRLGDAPDAADIVTKLNRVIGIGRLPLDVAQRFEAQHVRAAQAPLSEWHRQYVAPLQPWLSQYERVLIIPDGPMNRLPFACLFNNSTQRYLIEDHALTLAPSLAIWVLMQQRIRTAPPAAATPQAKPSVVSLGYSCAGRLPHAIEEAKAVAQFAQVGLGATQLLLESEATRARLWQAASQAQLIYIATHGQYRPDLPALSYLELADGRLEALDILDMELNAATVILSACETGAGKLTGNEMLGLVRAFLYAGARAVLATYWPVSDRATEVLMGHLMRRLGQGEPLASALRAAQCACIRGDALAATADSSPGLAHPYFWGALMLNGAS